MNTHRPTIVIAGHIEQLDDPDGLAISHISYVDYIQFDTPGDEDIEGRLQWNSEAGTLEVELGGGNVDLQIGQAHLIRCQNTTGNIINNGDVVYISGEEDNKPLITMSRADVMETSIVFGVATEDIAHNANGFVTTAGQVRTMNTSGLAEGNYVFLSAVTAGGLETSPAEAPNYKARVGYCLKEHATEGTILVDSSVVPRMVSLSDVYASGTPNNGEILQYVAGNSRWELGDHGSLAGLEDDDHPQYSNLKTGWDLDVFDHVSFSTNTGNRTFTLTPTGNVTYWISGTPYTINTPQAVIWDDVEGALFIYFEGSTLTASNTAWNFDETKALVAACYWDADNKELVTCSSELHSWVMSDRLHEYLHESFGTRWVRGLSVSTSDNEVLDVLQGEVYDEDIKISVTDDLDSGWWDQSLTPLNTQIIYREGAAGVWRESVTGTIPVILDANIPQINVLTGNSWGLSDVGVGRYFAYWVLATSDTNHPVFLVPGQEDGASLADAVDGNAFADMAFGALPSAEQKVIARCIVRRNPTSPYYQIEQIDDYRDVTDEPKSGGTGGAGGAEAVVAHEFMYNHPQYDIAYGWGDHSGLYEATGATATHESTYNHTQYDTAYGWGDHSGLYEATGATATHESTYNHAHYDTAYSWGDHAELYDTVGAAAAEVSTHESTYNHTQYDTAYTHSQNNSQAHSDYLVNDADDSTTGSLTALGLKAVTLIATGTGVSLRFDSSFGGGIGYRDTGNSLRTAMRFSSSTVSLENTTVNGTVEIAANTSTGGDPGRIVVGIFEDDEIDLLPSGGLLNVGGTITGSDADNWNIAHTHSQNNSQAHSDYLVNNANDATSGGLTVENLTTNTSLKLAAPSSFISFDAISSSTLRGILYSDAGGVGRIAMSLTDEIVAITNRAANGIVQIKANTSSAGGSGEIIVGIFEDNKIGLLPSGGTCNIGGNTNVTGNFAATGNITGAHRSSDETSGTTADVAVAKVGGGTRTLTFKDGLYISYSDS